MELTKIEVEAVQNAVAEATKSQLQKLNELQLALVGGGCGEISPY